MGKLYDKEDTGFQGWAEAFRWELQYGLWLYVLETTGKSDAARPLPCCT